MAEIALEQLTKVYPGGVVAVVGLSLRIAQGEFLALVGPSGCGKTTTLRLIAGLDTPTSGTVRINGRDARGLPPPQRDVALVFQRPALYPQLSVRDNLAFALRLRQPGLFGRLFRPGAARAGAVRIEERVTQTAALLGLVPLLERRPAQLSGGQQQRVALGRALVRRPGILLLDEPLSHLDGPLRAELRHELHLFHRQFPATILYVTHDPQEALALGDRIAVLEGGRLRQLGQPEGLCERPANRFVASFLGGPMNFFDGELVLDRERLTFVSEGLRLPLPASSETHWKNFVGRPLTLGARVGDVEIGPARPSAIACWTLAGRVVRVEPGECCPVVTLEAGDSGGGRFQIQGCQRRGETCKINEGDKVMVHGRLDRTHLFDRASGASLGHEEGPAG